MLWLTGFQSWIQIVIPINIDQSDEEVMAEVLRSWETAKNVVMGKPASPETINAIRELNSAAVGGQ